MNPYNPETIPVNTLATMSDEAQAAAVNAMVANAAARGHTLTYKTAAKHVAQLVESSRRPSMEFARDGRAEQRNIHRTVTALRESLRYGDTPLRVGAAIVATEVHDVLLYARDAPARMFGLPYGEREGDNLDLLETALRIEGPEAGSVQEQLVDRYVLPNGTPDAQAQTAAAIAQLMRGASNPIPA